MLKLNDNGVYLKKKLFTGIDGFPIWSLKYVIRVIRPNNWQIFGKPFEVIKTNPFEISIKIV